MISKTYELYLHDFATLEAATRKADELIDDFRFRQHPRDLVRCQVRIYANNFRKCVKVVRHSD